MRYWEDLSVGEVFDLGTHTVTREQIVDVATQWDPQPFHIDDAAAQATKDSRRGTVVLRWQAVNQDGVVALRMSGRGLFGRRSPGS